MSYANPTCPNLPDFATFVASVMQVDPLYLPTPSTDALTAPFYRGLRLVIGAPCCDAYDYTSAVYNYAGHVLVATAIDQPGRTFFRDLRKSYGITGGFAAGVVQSTSDASDSTSLAVPDGLKNLTLSDLDLMKTPWGRAALAFNQDFGGIWGIS
jgi:hypothetical protein